MQRIGTFVLALLLVLSLALPVWAQDDDPALLAVDYLTTMQNEDGGFTSGWAPESDIATTADVLMAVWSVGGGEEDYVTAAVDYLAEQVAAGNVVGAGLVAKVVSALVMLDVDPTEFGDANLVDDLLATQDETGLFGTGAFEHCLAMIALQNTEIEVTEETVEALLAVQDEDGGWGFMDGVASDTNTTGLCLQALALTDETEAIDAGFAYLSAIQNEDAGWPYQNPSEYGTDSDTNSTALVVQALIANGADLEEWNNPQDWLLTLQNESGSFSYQAVMPGDNVTATVGVIPAVMGVPFNSLALDMTEME